MITSGSRGTSVSQAQTALSKAGFDPHGVDGIFGKNTRAAVESFQAAHGLKVDGIIGKDTGKALLGDRYTDSFDTSSVSPTKPVTGDRPCDAITRLAQQYGLEVTSTTGGKHSGWAHKIGYAADIRTRGVPTATLDAFMQAAKNAGYAVIDERFKAASASWSGPHLHVQAPKP
jgi:Putative peptidoglycan binding domain